MLRGRCHRRDRVFLACVLLLPTVFFRRVRIILVPLHKDAVRSSMVKHVFIYIYIYIYVCNYTRLVLCTPDFIVLHYLRQVSANPHASHSEMPCALFELDLSLMINLMSQMALWALVGLDQSQEALRPSTAGWLELMKSRSGDPKVAELLKKTSRLSGTLRSGVLSYL